MNLICVHVKKTNNIKTFYHSAGSSFSPGGKGDQQNDQIRARVDYNSMTLNLNSATCPRGSMISCYRILSVWGPLPPPGATPTAWNSPRLSANSQVANSQVANNNSLKSPSAPLKSFESLKPLKSPSSSTAPASPDLLAQCGRPTLLLQRRSAPCIRYKFQIFHFI